MKYFVLAFVVGCSSTPYTRLDCDGSKAGCYYEDGWDSYSAPPTSTIGTIYQCNSNVDLENDECFKGNTYGNSTLWCCK